MSVVVSSPNPAMCSTTATATKCDPVQIARALQRAREAMHRTGRPAIVRIWVDPREYAPGAKNRTMYK